VARKSWEHNDELTEFTFHLRDDVTFSDGSPFTAEVVKANFDQYVHGDPGLGIDEIVDPGTHFLERDTGRDTPSLQPAALRRTT
jgi:ABC-type transport system substrate-binding protein